MKITGEFLFNGPQQAVWDLMQDPEALATALPGTKSLEQLSESEYEGEMNIRVGPVAGVFSGRVALADQVPPESLTMTVDGKGKPGFVKGTGQVELVPQETDKTLMKYQGEIQVGGRLASAGQRLLDTASKSMIGEGLTTLDKVLQARVAAAPGEAPVEVEAPSETEFAAAVAKDVTREVVKSSRLLQVAIIVAGILLFVILALLLTSGGG
jgi:carbon monoxide dehydrogenase subunit G